jgi:hypothetical protein
MNDGQNLAMNDSAHRRKKFFKKEMRPILFHPLKKTSTPNVYEILGPKTLITL